MNETNEFEELELLFKQQIIALTKLSKKSNESKFDEDRLMFNKYIMFIKKDVKSSIDEHFGLIDLLTIQENCHE
jgi:hypothetical protein